MAAAGAALLLLGVLTRTNGPYALAALAWVPLLVAPAVTLRRARSCRPLSLHVRAMPPLVPVGASISIEVAGSNRGSLGTPVWASSGAGLGGRVCWRRPRRRCARFPAWRPEKARRPW